MADLEVIEQFLDVDTDTKRLRDGKKNKTKNQFYYFANRFYIIKLSRNKWMICSDDDNTRRLLRKYIWRVHPAGYAMTNIGKSTKCLHQVYLKYQSPNVADHLNNRRYDNRAENLRVVQPTQNMRNRTKSKTNTSGKQGVSKCTMRGIEYWRAHIIDNDGKPIFRCFSINTLGDKAAKQLAIEKRLELERLHGYLGD